MNCRDHQAISRALREIVFRVVDGFFRHIRDARAAHRLSEEHATALIALRRHHERMQAIHGDRYTSSWAASHAGRAHPDRELGLLFDETHFALLPLRLAEMQVAAERGQCSPIDEKDIAAFKARGILFRAKTEREVADARRREEEIEALDSLPAEV